MANILNVENVSKGYGDKTLLRQVQLGVNEGDKIGIVGVNGSGKTTLLKIVAGLVEPDEGKIIKNRQTDIAYLAQDTEFLEGDTPLSYVMRGTVNPNPEWNLEGAARSVLNKLCIFDVEKEISPMSGGEKKRIALAKTLLVPAKILILDEPTNHLDTRMVMWLEEYLIKFKGVLLMVTHDRYFLDRVTNRIVEIDKGNLYAYDASYSGFLELRQQRIDSETVSYRKVQSILRTELLWVRRGAQARSTKQKARLERFEKLQAVKPVEETKQMEMDSLAARLGRKTIEVEHICKAYDENVLIRDFTYYTLRNERIGIVGENGCGKTTLLKLLLGLEQPDSGSITIGETVRIGYFSQTVEEMNPEQRVIDYVKDIAEYIRTEKGMTSASQMCERFLFTPDIQYNPICKLSGGERRRLYLLGVLMTAPNVLVLDEPTNDLDIATLTILEDYLDAFEGIVIAVSHDRYFLDRIVDRILAFEGKGIITQYEGDYTTYMEKAIAKGTYLTGGKRPEAALKEQADNKESDSRSTWKGNREKKLKFTYQEQKEYDTIDMEIEELETQIAELDEEMQQVASQYGKLQELNEKKQELENVLEKKMERWVYLNELASRIEKQ